MIRHVANSAANISSNSTGRKSLVKLQHPLVKTQFELLKLQLLDYLFSTLLLKSTKLPLPRPRKVNRNSPSLILTKHAKRSIQLRPQPPLPRSLLTVCHPDLSARARLLRGSVQELQREKKNHQPRRNEEDLENRNLL